MSFHIRKHLLKIQSWYRDLKFTARWRQPKASMPRKTSEDLFSGWQAFSLGEKYSLHHSTIGMGAILLSALDFLRPPSGLRRAGKAKVVILAWSLHVPTAMLEASEKILNSNLDYSHRQPSPQTCHRLILNEINYSKMTVFLHSYSILQSKMGWEFAKCFVPMEEQHFIQIKHMV